jgi:hypothetical protein
MNALALDAAAPPPAVEPAPRDRLNVVRTRVRELLENSESFRALAPDQQREIAKNTVEIVNYLCAPEGIPADRLAKLNPPNTPTAAALAEPGSRSRRGQSPGEVPQFTAQGRKLRDCSCSR